MKDPVVVIGSGASAAHFALTALGLGRRVIMLDVGYAAPPHARPDASLNGLKAELPDPVGYFLGERFEGLLLPIDSSEYYGIPPNKDYVLRGVAGLDLDARGFAPLSSYATGGLAQAWTGGCYPFTDGELKDFPFGWGEIAPHYSEVARRIGVSGVLDDDLAPYMPAHDGIEPPIALDAHSAALLKKYERKRRHLTAKHGLYLGRARLASLSQDREGRRGCVSCGRCLWGCPHQSFYTPAITVEACRRHPAFTYVSGVRIDHFRYDDGARITHVVGRALDSDVEHVWETGSLALAAGTLGTARILLKSLQRQGERVELRGLMDNRQALMPFVDIGRLGARFSDQSYQYNQLSIGAPAAEPFDYVHGLLTTLTTALVHPLIQTLPFGARFGTAMFRNIHGALGLANINFPDRRREQNRLALETSPEGRGSRLVVSYAPAPQEAERIAPVVDRFRAFLAALGCIAPASMTRLRPMGASVHYAGALPMLSDGGDLTTERTGRCRPFENLIIADGSTFPALPAKNLTFTLMANASRIAHESLVH
jgi:choline dehydrogenase-like flavoprotein